MQTVLADQQLHHGAEIDRRRSGTELSSAERVDSVAPDRRARTVEGPSRRRTQIGFVVSDSPVSAASEGLGRAGSLVRLPVASGLWSGVARRLGPRFDSSGSGVSRLWDAVAGG